MSTAPLNILVVSQFYDSHRGGLEIVAGHLAREWTERGMNVRWAAADLTPPPPALAATGRAARPQSLELDREQARHSFSAAAPLRHPQTLA